MDKKTVVLADNSYTIRRIVELSFAEEEIELISFENGLNLKEKLVEIKPAVILVDIKLPEINGYEVCKFVSETDSLNHTKVFLMKGGFEPVDENIIKDLQYVDIITKPFDSNALVSSIKRILEESPADTEAAPPIEAPSSLPEDLPEIDNISEPEVGISFSDIKEEIDAEEEMKEEVQPSEEITQGAQPEKEDALSPNEAIDDIENPFKDDEQAAPEGQEQLSEEELKIKENIKKQEEELEIGSLTMEEIKIKEHIKKQQVSTEKEELTAEEEPEEKQEDTAETFEDSALDMEEEKAEQEEPSVMSDLMGEPEAKEEAEEEVKEPEVEPSTPAEPVEEVATEPEPEEKETEKVPVSELLEDLPAEEQPAEEPEVEPEIEEPKPPEEPEIESKPEIPSEEVVEEIIESPKEKTDEFEKEIEDQKLFEDVEETKEPEVESEITSAQKDEILHKVEDKLTVSIKEVLWEIVPPLAEKIIKEEIEKIKSQIDQEYTK